jgi:hypothetical protein
MSPETMPLDTEPFCLRFCPREALRVPKSSMHLPGPVTVIEMLDDS